MPQFDTSTWSGQIFWLLVTFGLLYLALRQVFIPRIRHAIDTRRGQIETDMAEARRLRDEAQVQAEIAEAQMHEARRRAQTTAADAKARALAQSAARQSVLEAELSAKLSLAESRIRLSRDQAMGQVRGIAAETATAITEHLAGTPVSSTELDRALDIAAPVPTA